MEKNIGNADKGLRSVLVVVFVYLGYTYHWAFYLLAALLVYTIATGVCLPYKWFGINTNK